MSGLLRGRYHEEIGTGKAVGHDGDTVVQPGQEDDMVVFGEDEACAQDAYGAELYLVRSRYLHTVHCPYKR